MEAGGHHPLSLRRRFSTSLAMTLVLACWLLLPAAADAAVTLPEAPNATAAVLDTVHTAIQPAAAAVAPPSAPQAPQHVPEVQRPVPAVQPVPAPPVVTSIRPAPTHAVRTAAASAAAHHPKRPDRAERLVGTREHHAAATVAATVSTSRPATHVATVVEPTKAPTPLSGSERSPGSAGGAPASTPFTTFLFGGGFALLIGALLLAAGPGLRRLLTMPQAVCRPAAFLAVLERPG
jgi:hypothetical protein